MNRMYLWLGLLSVALVGGAAPRAGADEPANGGTVREYVFKKTEPRELKLYVHLPPGWKATDRRPGIVFFFGGGWVKGSPTQFTRQAEYLAQRGMVAARADYRLNQGPAVCVEDARSAVRWLRAHARDLGLNPDRIAGAGGSAGGHLAACVTLTDGPSPKDEDPAVSSRPNLMVLFNPVLDMEAISGFVGRPAEELRAISPIAHLAKGAPPAVIFFGTADRLLQQGRAFLAKSKALGNRVELYTAEGQPHGFFNRSPWQDATLRKADEFLVSAGYLQGPPTLKAAGSELRAAE